ncbi:hypothetical protein SeMB42_g02554 [Synchytrium endobioticum]|nr:hypothetical protein SeMB42_g02554 [Synchytrium endobioticum]
MPSQNYTLPGVLHYLQSEWRRFERNRNDWEIEKSDLQSRIAFLESERRGMDNIRTDLLRRIRMLEYALRQERSKYVGLQAQISGQTLAETVSDASESPEPGAVAAMLAGSTHTLGERGMTPDMLTSEYGGVGSVNSTLSRGINGSHGGTLLHYSKGVGYVRTREILKNYLREAGQLTAPSMVAGLPLRTTAEEGISGSDTLNRLQTATSSSSSLSSSPSLAPRSLEYRSTGATASTSGRTAVNGTTSENVPTTDLGEFHSTSPLHGSSIDTFAQNSLYRQNTVKKTGSTVVGKPMDHEVPSVEEVQEKLRLSTDEKTHRMMNKWISKSSAPNAHRDDPLASLSLSEDDTDESTTKKSSGAKDATPSDVIWRPKGTLRGHMDAVRSVALHPALLSVLSGSEDCTAKLWNLQEYEGAKKPPQDLEPIFTYRGHTGPITAVSFGSGTSPDRCFTASVDSTICEWRLPPLIRDVYAPYDSKLQIHSYVGHSDAVWDVKPQPSSSAHASSILASCAADGTVKIWNTNANNDALKLTIRYNGVKSSGTSTDTIDYPPSEGPNPTSIDWIPSNLTRLIVAYQNSAVKVFDIITGSEVLSLKSSDSYDGTTGTQINKIVCHSTMSLAVTAHEDRFLRIFDLNSGQCLHSMIAHLDAVTTLDVHPLGLSVVSGGHDCSMRFWDLSTRNCVQEYSSHRRKGNEGMWSAKFHPTLHDTLASGGADSTVKLYRHGTVS